MRELLHGAERSGGPRPEAGSPAQQAARALALVDHSLHVLALLARTGAYLLLALVARRYECGPHLAAGVLFGDFAGYAALAAATWRRAPKATIAEGLLFGILFLVWWLGHPFPAEPEHRALFCLTALAMLAGRIGGAARAFSGTPGA